MLKRILGVFSANATGQIINTVLRVLSVPVFLHFWGKALYGEWILLLTIPSYLAVSGTGIGNVAANEMVMKNANGLQKEALSIFQSAWLFVNLISLVFVAVSVAVALAFPVADWLNITHISPFHTAIAFILLAVYTVFFLQGELLVGAYRADEKFAKGILAYSLITLFENVGLLITVTMTNHVLIAVSVYLLIRVIGTCLMGYNLARKAGWFAFGIKHARRSIIKSNLLPTFSFLGLNIGNALGVQGIVTIIGIRLGASAVVGFTVVRTIINLVKQFSSLIYYTVWPELSTAFATQNIPLAKRLHRYACHITLVVALFNITLLFFAGQPVVRIWTNGKVDIDYSFFILMLVSLVPGTFWITSSYVQISINKFQKLAFIYLIISAAALIVTYYTVSYLGLTGVPLVQIVADTLMLAVVLKGSLALVQDNLPGFVRSMFDFRYVKRVKKIPDVIFRKKRAARPMKDQVEANEYDPVFSPEEEVSET